MKYFLGFLAVFLNVLAGVPAALAIAPVAYLSDHKPSSTNGGTCNSGTWQTRTLNTIDDPTGVVGSFASNQFKLNPGTYEFSATAPAGAVNQHKARLYNVTDGVVSLIGSSEYASAAEGTYSNSGVYGLLTLNHPTTFRIEHRCAATKSGDGFGSNTNVGVDEVYTQMRVVKLPDDYTKVAYIYERVSSGAPAGGCVAGIWTPRHLTTLVGPGTFVTLSSPTQFTLAPGNYNIGAVVPMGFSDEHQIALYNTTTGTTILAGSAEMAQSTSSSSNLYGTFTISSPTTFEIVHLCSSGTPSNGMGTPSSFGIDEIYAQIKIDQL